MEYVAKASGTVDKLVAIKSKNLSSGYNYLGIVELLAKARRSDEALQWAGRGLKTFPDRPDQRLRDFVVVAYLKRKRNDEAVALTWAQFEESPDLESYKKLHGITRKPGVWPAQCVRALAKIEAPRAEDGTTLYREVVPVIVAQTGNEAYAEAVKLVRKIGAMMKAQNRLARFGDYLAKLRAGFKQKRNFIKLLDRVGGRAPP